MDEDAVVSFITLTHQDCIADESMYPWLGFLYTEPNYRGHRYSEQIIQHALSVAKDMGHNEATDKVGLLELGDATG
jgi:GNAT superfamily N-acetyltransferase